MTLPRTTTSPNHRSRATLRIKLPSLFQSILKFLKEVWRKNRSLTKQLRLREPKAFPLPRATLQITQKSLYPPSTPLIAKVLLRLFLLRFPLIHNILKPKRPFIRRLQLFQTQLCSSLMKSFSKATSRSSHLEIRRLRSSLWVKLQEQPSKRKLYFRSPN